MTNDMSSPHVGHLQAPLPECHRLGPVPALRWLLCQQADVQPPVLLGASSAL